jgi:hypothetical protein
MATAESTRRGNFRPNSLAISRPQAALEQEPEAPEPPAEVKNLDYWQCLLMFKTADVDSDGKLQCHEFAKFIAMVYPSDVWSIDTTAFFNAVDIDGSGELDLEEFLGWAYSVPSVKSIRPCSQRAKALAALAKSSSNTSIGRSHSPASLGTASPSREPLSPMSPISPTSPKRPQSRLSNVGAQLVGTSPGDIMVLEVVVDPSFCVGENTRSPSMMAQLDNMIKQAMLGQVMLKRKIDHNTMVTGCLKVTALLGTGVVFWDKSAMIAYKEDPFQTVARMKEWTKNMTQVHVPLLFRTMNR